MTFERKGFGNVGTDFDGWAFGSSRSLAPGVFHKHSKDK